MKKILLSFALASVATSSLLQLSTSKRLYSVDGEATTAMASNFSIKYYEDSKKSVEFCLEHINAI